MLFIIHGQNLTSECLVAVKMTQMADKTIVVPLTRPPEFLFDVYVSLQSLAVERLYSSSLHTNSQLSEL